MSDHALVTVVRRGFAGRLPSVLVEHVLEYANWVNHVSNGCACKTCGLLFRSFKSRSLLYLETSSDKWRNLAGACVCTAHSIYTQERILPGDADRARAFE